MKKSGKCQTKRDRPVYSRIATTSHARRKPIGPMARIQGISKSPSCISAWFMENDDSKKRGPNARSLAMARTIPAARLPKIQPCRTESKFALTRVHFPSCILPDGSSGQNASESLLACLFHYSVPTTDLFDRMFIIRTIPGTIGNTQTNVSHCCY